MMILHQKSVVLIAISVSPTLADSDLRGFRSLKTKGGAGNGKSNVNGQGQDHNSTSIIVDEINHPQPQSTGRVIIRRKTEKKLKEEGKSPNAIAQARAKGLGKIKNNKVVFDSGGERDFQVVEVGRGHEKKFMEDLLNDDVDGVFEYVEEDFTVYADETTPNDPIFEESYHHRLMQSALAWDLTTGSPAITIGICDSGVQLDHPDLAANRLPGYNAFTQCWEDDADCEPRQFDCCWEDDLFSALQPSASICVETSETRCRHEWYGDASATGPHGTNCAGYAAALGDNSEGVVGMGWRFFHRAGKVAVDGRASSYVLADCARKMCEKPDVKVVNLSFSGPETQTRRDAASFCKEHGALLVNAAGNDGRNLSEFGEADDDDLIVVGASTEEDTKASFSAYGRFVDLWAPGHLVWTTTLGSDYIAISGTSFAAPLVSGLIGLIWSKNPELMPNEVEEILKQTTDDVAIQTDWNTMYGRANAFRAVSAAGSGTPFPTQSPTTAKPTSSPTVCEDIMCDDGNICTVDSCNRGGADRCNNIPIDNCCGNGVCEPDAGETSSNCFDDCNRGPFTITGPACDRPMFDRGECNISGGLMFDVVSKHRDIHVSSIKIETWDADDAEVWVRPGTHVGHEDSSEGWTKVAEHSFGHGQVLDLLVIPESSFIQTVNIPPGGRMAFYVTYTTSIIEAQGMGSVWYAGTMFNKFGERSTDAISSEDNDIIIYEGVERRPSFHRGIWGPLPSDDFPDLKDIVQFSGEIEYTTTIPGVDPSTSPTTSPTGSLVCEEWHPNGHVCDGNEGSHGWSGTDEVLGQWYTRDQCRRACAELGKGCCETRASTSAVTSRSWCLWKREKSMRFSTAHSGTSAMFCDFPDPNATGSPTQSPTSSPTMHPTVSPQPTKSPTSSPTKQPVAPTTSPSKQPTAAPIPLADIQNVCDPWPSRNYNTCNGNGGSHGWAGEYVYLGGGMTRTACKEACEEQGPGCCETRARYSYSWSTGHCIWKSEPTVGYSSRHSDTNAVICETPDPNAPVCQEWPSTNYRVCNGNGGSHGMSGTYELLGSSMTRAECSRQCARQGPGCCETHARTSSQYSRGACIWKSEPTVGSNSYMSWVTAVICS